MKKIGFFFCLLLLSCSTNDTIKSEYALLPVQEVVYPSAFKKDSISIFKIKYKRPTDCYLFNGFYYNSNGNVRTVAIESVRLLENNCQPDIENQFEVPLNFMPKNSGTYNFKFWKGTDVSGTDLYTTFDAVVP